MKAEPDNSIEALSRSDRTEPSLTDAPTVRKRPRTRKGQFAPAPLELEMHEANGAHDAAVPALIEAEPDALGHQPSGQPLDHDLAVAVPEPATHPAGPRDPRADGQGVTPTSSPDTLLPDLRRTAPTPVVSWHHRGPAGGRAPRGHSAAGRHPGTAGRPHTPDRARRDTRC